MSVEKAKEAVSMDVNDGISWCKLNRDHLGFMAFCNLCPHVGKICSNICMPCQEVKSFKILLFQVKKVVVGWRNISNINIIFYEYIYITKTICDRDGKSPDLDSCCDIFVKFL